MQKYFSAIIGNSTLKIFRWVNLLPLPATDDIQPKDIQRIFILESRNNPMSRSEYLNPNIGDLPFELLLDIFKCSYYNRQPKEPQLTRELDTVLQSYSDFICENWLSLEKGSYNEGVTQGPIFTFRERITESMIRENAPELSLEEKVLIQMQTMDIPKDRSAQYLAEAGKPSEFQMLEAEKKKTERKLMGSSVNTVAVNS